MPQIKPGTPAPDLAVETVGGGTWRLSDQTPENLSLIIVYRGLHCPICKSYLQAYNEKVVEFADAGISLIAISSDPAERAQQSKEEWELDKLAIGYGWPIEEAREWGLFISNAIREQELKTFPEPGLFAVKPDGTLYWSCVSSMPFARPPVDEVLRALVFTKERGYPPRGGD